MHNQEDLPYHWPSCIAIIMQQVGIYNMHAVDKNTRSLWFVTHNGKTPHELLEVGNPAGHATRMFHTEDIGVGRGVAPGAGAPP